jgi:hypothetical protein
MTRLRDNERAYKNNARRKIDEYKKGLIELKEKQCQEKK